MSQDGSEKKKDSPFGKYKIEIIIIKNGINDHIFRRLNDFPYTVKNDKKSYEIKKDGLFKTKLPIRKIIMNLLSMIVGEYKIIFWEGEKEPIMRYDPNVSPRVLKVARNSTAATQMIKEWFEGRKFPINKWAFILIVATIGTIIYAKLSGMI
ncbi:MAG: hypothetical protein ACW99F_13195 [Candidatus Hodarchaeales archaeon]